MWIIIASIYPTGFYYCVGHTRGGTIDWTANIAEAFRFETRKEAEEFRRLCPPIWYPAAIHVDN
jgi:hypothetical protein